MKRRHEASAQARGLGGYRLLAAFFASGLAGVMHEVVWSRQLERLIGAAAYAQALVLAVFMGGLAAGAALIGRRADRGRPLSLYLRLEVLIAVYALAIPLLLRVAGAGYEALARHFLERDAVRVLLRLTLAALIVAPPAALMGGTLPLLARRLSAASVEGRVGALYAFNSLGAAVGTAVAGFLALPLLGTWGALAAASAANLLAAALVAPEARREEPLALMVPAPDRPAGPRPSPVLLAALLASGLAAMGYEVLFIRVVGLAFGSSTHSFTVMLICFIAGISLGSGLVTRLSLRGSPWLLAVSQLAVVVAFLVATPLLARLGYFIDLGRVRLQGSPAGFEWLQLVAAGLCLAVLLVPTACLGFAFPLVAGLRAADGSTLGARVGATYAWGTAGNVLGVMVTTLVLLPWLGLEHAFHLLWGLNLVAGLALLVVARGVPVARRWVPAALGVAAVAIYAALGTGWSETLRLVPDHLMLRTGPPADASAEARAAHPTASFAAWKKTYLLSAAEPPFDQVALAEDAHNTVVAFGPHASTEGGVALAVNNKVDASTVSDLATQMLLAHAPMFLVPRARAVLVIGHGSGVTAGSALVHPVESADIVEISPAVLKVDKLFEVANHHVLSDPRVRVIVDDGQSFLRAVPRTYDVIISEPSNPWIAGIGDLFTREFFELARSKLNQGGAFTLWFHTYAQSDDTTRLLLRTLGSVFPHVHLFTDDRGDVVAVGTVGQVVPEFSLMERRFAGMAVRRDFKRLNMDNLTALLGLHRLSGEGAEALAGPGPVNSVSREQLQYSGPRALFAGTDSFFLEERDPYLRPPSEQKTQTLLDRYAAFRAAQGRPLAWADYEAAASFSESRGEVGANVARGIRARLP